MSAISKLIADTKSTFKAVPADAAALQALSGDRIEIQKNGKTTDVLTVTTVKKRILITQSLVTDNKIRMGVMEYAPAGVNLQDGEVAFLHKSPTAPMPGRKGQKKVVGAPTKMSLCTAIFLENPEAEKKDVCKRFQAEANCTRMGANTYYLMIAKKHQAGELTNENAGE